MQKLAGVIALTTYYNILHMSLKCLTFLHFIGDVLKMCIFLQSISFF